jgi:hypothetical protein
MGGLFRVFGIGDFVDIAFALGVEIILWQFTHFQIPLPFKVVRISFLDFWLRSPHLSHETKNLEKSSFLTTIHLPS